MAVLSKGLRPGPEVAGAVGVREEAGGFVIGAATSGALLGEHPRLSRVWPGVVEGANLIGSTHGDTIPGKDLISVMATDKPEAWGRTRPVSDLLPPSGSGCGRAGKAERRESGAHE